MTQAIRHTLKVYWGLLLYIGISLFMRLATKPVPGWTFWRLLLLHTVPGVWIWFACWYVEHRRRSTERRLQEALRRHVTTNDPLKEKYYQ